MNLKLKILELQTKYENINKFEFSKLYYVLRDLRKIVEFQSLPKYDEHFQNIFDSTKSYGFHEATNKNQLSQRCIALTRELDFLIYNLDESI